MEREASKAWAYMRFGTAGDYAKNDTNGKEIVRVSNYIDTLWFECNCYESGNFDGKRYGRDAVEWLMA